MADFLKAGEVPEVWEITTLLGLHRLHGAVVAIQKNAFAIRLLLKREPATVLGEPRELLDERNLSHAFERGESRDFAIAQAHVAGPPATGGATLAFMEDRHDLRLRMATTPAKSKW